MSTPALTAEERARDVTALLMKRLPGTGISIVMADRDDAHAQIASAIREAEDAAYARGKTEYIETISNCILMDKARYAQLRRGRIAGFDEKAPLPSDRTAEPFLLKSQKETP